MLAVVAFTNEFYIRWPGTYRGSSPYANFIIANFISANFISANFISAYFISANLISANFISANFISANFISAIFQNFPKIFGLCFYRAIYFITAISI